MTVTQLLKKGIRKLFPRGKSAAPAVVERAEYLFYLNYLRPGMVVFDIGANIGELTLLFSRFLRKTGTVHAFEPSTATYEKLKFITSASRYPNIVLNRKAVSDRIGLVTLQIYDDEHCSWNSLVNRDLGAYGIDLAPVRTEDAESVTIDSYCEDNGVRTIDLLKIDAEGAEYQVLLGARTMFSEKRIGCCIFEFGATTFDMGNDPMEIIAHFRDCGYVVKNIIEKDPVFPGRTSARDARFSMHVARPKS